MKHQPLAEEHEDENTCRICLEPEENDNPLLTPCLCTGSVKYIHEQCLKVWLVAKETDLEKVRCELCKAYFEMKFRFKHKCAPCDLCEENIAHWFFMPLLCAVFCMLILIAYVILKKLKSFEEERIYTMVLLGTCGLSCLMIVYLCYNSVKEACFTEELCDWVILSRTDHGESKLQERSASTQLEMSDTSMIADIMKVPLTVRIGRKVIKTPYIPSPNLTPVHNEGSLVGYTSRLRSARASLDYNRQISYSARVDDAGSID